MPDIPEDGHDDGYGGTDGFAEDLDEALDPTREREPDPRQTLPIKSIHWRWYPMDGDKDEDLQD